MNLEKELAEGNHAEQLLKDETLKGAFENVRQALFHRIEQTPLRDEEGLRDLRKMLKLLRDVKANLEMAVRNGKLAAEDIRIKRERKLRLFR